MRGAGTNKEKINERLRSTKPPGFVFYLLAAFLIVFETASIVAFSVFRKASDNAIQSNRTRANLIAKIILELEGAAIGALQSFAVQPTFIDNVEATQEFQLRMVLTPKIRRLPYLLHCAIFGIIIYIACATVSI